MVIERMLMLGAVALAVAIIWGLARIWQRRSVARMRAESPFHGLVEGGAPAIVSFSTPSCAECRSRQAPALELVERELGGGVRIVRVSALDRPDLVDQAGIMTVPATVVIDGAGAVRHLNLGFADAPRLIAQVRNACAASETML